MTTMSPTAQPGLSRSVSTADGPSTGKIILWTLLFQLAWHFRAILPFIKEGNFKDSDDFLRLHQMRNWMDDHSWFDVSVPRMNPPVGGDMHWSRLVDVPLAALTWFFDLFTDTVVAERLAAIVWPTVLLVLTVMTLIAICEKLFPATNRMLTVLFTASCATAMVEFAPARIDHHNVQILLFSLILLGLVNADRKWGHYVIGSAMAVSVVIGLDLAMMLALILAWLGLEWVSGMDRDGGGLMRTAIALAATSILLYPVSVAPAQWFVEQCDAISPVYLSAFLVISAGFTTLRLASPYLPSPGKHSKQAMVISRMAAGGVAGGAVLAILYTLYPQCIAGPLSGISPELKTLWLDIVIEAKSLVASVETMGAGMYALPAFLVMNLVLGLVLLCRGVVGPRFIAIWAAIAITLVLGFFQIRTLRIGMFATVPVGVIAAHLAWQFFQDRYKESRIMALAATALTGLALISPTWLIAGNALATLLSPTERIAASANSKDGLPAWALDPSRTGCHLQSDYAALAALPAGHVFNAINIGPAILVFTDHTIIGANYHRNEEAILSTYRFFHASADEARAMANAKNVDYVVMCKLHPDGVTKVERDDRFGSRLLHGDAPDWLDVLTSTEDRLVIGRVIR